ncbi:MAG: molybdenum ABC transporter ATP-binding protein [Henriciella sp.]|nr:molybdenum ABC transporter ATP-binding protein [Henriciella sp.]
MSGSELTLSAEIALDDFTLTVDEHVSLNGVTAVFGPSGSGKTSLLNLVAGFLRPDRGEISFGDEIWAKTEPKAWVPPHRRPVGTVFQDAQLFPHLSVRGNLDYADKRADKTAPGHARTKIIDAMALSPLLNRTVQTLSGGERQRVAIARTLLTRPRLLLLDEPLSALDGARKAELLPFLETLKTEFALPTLYVSHDVDEVSRIADRVMMLEAGRVIATGRTDDVLSRFGLEAGRNPYEQAAFLSGVIDQEAARDGLIAVRIGEATIWPAANVDLASGARVSLKIPARDVSIALEEPTGISIQNMLSASVVAIEPTKRPAFQTVTLSVGDQTILATVTRKAVTDLALAPGRAVFALIKSATFHH